MLQSKAPQPFPARLGCKVPMHSTACKQAFPASAKDVSEPGGDVRIHRLPDQSGLAEIHPTRT